MEIPSKKAELVLRIVVLLIILLIWAYGELFQSDIAQRLNSKRINLEFKGLVIRKFASRGDYVNSIEIQARYKTFRINPSAELLQKISVGDSLLKTSKTNEVVIKRKDGTVITSKFIDKIK